MCQLTQAPPDPRTWDPFDISHVPEPFLAWLAGCQGDYCVYTGRGGYFKYTYYIHFVFEDEDDALLFMLTWADELLFC